MRKGDPVRYEGAPAVLAGIRLGHIGDIDGEGNGILRPAMVADVKITDDQGRVLRKVKDVPVAELQAAG